MIVTSVQIKTAKTQKHLYCPVFTTKPLKAEAFKGFIYEHLWIAKRLRQFKSEPLLIFILQAVPPADVIL